MDTNKKQMEDKVRQVRTCLTSSDDKRRKNAPKDSSFLGNSPLSGVPHDRNSPVATRNRDSGYVTDNSPATFSPYSHFTFDLPPQEEHGAVGGVPSPQGLEDSGSDIMDNFETGVFFDIEEEGDDSAFLDEVDGISDNEGDTSGETYRNVATLQRQVSQPMAVPLSPPIADIALRNGVQAPFTLPGRYYSRVASVATQTPHVLSQMLHHVISEPAFVTQSRGTVLRRLRHSSDSDDFVNGQSSNAHGPLPDIIPHVRDRSVSLPDMQALRVQRELEVGRELRRLSDEFNTSYSRGRERRRASITFEMAPSNSFPGARRNAVSSFMDIFRSMFLRSPSPLDEREDDIEPS
ncbi:hypothetical protein LOTGIDRAFT_161572 [Lottia gigantea]|uniref:Uncharacterized protein n=1 Tax=Lottia gigantea TaxID=225164 RepID=V4AL96_LOTGI|nr:hypothetical protein LOTGIDRAFT_161572 [Lottia gigantea]ESO94346.1 hypothetical protein LOTGIDRAFT_161572 [Lottia gigantea]